EANAILQATVESGYERFLSLVAQARGVSRDRADELGQGRVWDGGSARQLGLVDEFGGLDSAMAWAGAQADLGEGAWDPGFLGANESAYPALLRRLLPGAEESGGKDMFALLARRESDLATRMLADLRGLLAVRGVQARCMECPVAAGNVPPAADGQGGNSLIG